MKFPFAPRRLLPLIVLVACSGGSGGGNSSSVQGPTFYRRSPEGAWIASFAFHPVDANTFYLGHDDGGGVYKTTDGGATFSFVGPRNTSAWTMSINPVDGNEIFAGDHYGKGVYRTTNGGGSWEFRNTGLPAPSLAPPAEAPARVIHALQINPATPAAVFAFTDDGFYRTADSGGSWTKPAAQPVGIPRIVSGSVQDRVSMVATPGGRLFCGGFAGPLYFSTDGGDTWILQRDFAGEVPAQQVMDLDIDPTDTHLYVTTLAADNFVRVYRASFTDAGVAWAAGANPYAPFASSFAFAQLAPRGPVKYLGVWGTGNGAVWRTVDDGANWTSVANNIPAASRAGLRIACHPLVAAPSNVFYSAFESLFLSTNADAAVAGDVVWTERNYGLTSTYAAGFAIDPGTPNRMYLGLLKGRTDAVTPGLENLYVSTDAGQTWAALPNFVWNPVSLSVQPSAPATLVAGTFDSGIKWSTNSGQTWAATDLSAGLVMRALFHRSSTAPYATQAYAAVTSPAANAGVYRSTSSGASWTRTLQANAPSTASFQDVAVSPTDADTLYAAGALFNAAGALSEGGVWLSINQGQTWSNKGPPIQGTAVAQSPANAATVLCGTAAGLYRTTNVTATTPIWTLVDPGWQGTVTAIIFRTSQDIFVAINAGDRIPVSLPAPSPGVWRSQDGGNSWLKLSDLVEPSENFWWGAAVPGTDNVFYFPGYGAGLFRLELPAFVTGG